MSLNFETVSLGEHLYIKGRIGWKGLKKDEYLDQGDYRIINATALEEEGINWEDCGYISKERFEESPEIILKNKDILISKDGTIGKLGYVKDLEMDSTVASGIFVVRNQNEEYIDTDFLYYYFKSPFFKWFIKSVTEGSVIPHLYQRDFTDMEFNLFNLDTQKKCASILNAIEEKINVNRKINKNLEQYLFYIFNETFMNFEFNEFSHSNDKIPSSWGLGTFNDIIDSLGSGDWGKDELTGNYTSEVYCIRGADIPDVKRGNKGKMPIRYILPKNFKNKKLIKNTIVLEISGGSPTQSTGRTVFITEDFLNRFDKDLICTNFCKVIKPLDNYEIFIYLYLNYLYNKDVMFAYENGTTGIKNFDIKSFINNFLIVIPSQKDVINFNKLVKDVFNIIMHNGLEIEKLQQLRDTLLPKLMSGEIDVSKINCDLKNIIKNFIKKFKCILSKYLYETKIISKIINYSKFLFSWILTSIR